MKIHEKQASIVCANCHLANKSEDIEVPQAVLPDTVFEAVVRIPYDIQLKEMQVLGYTPDHFTFPFVLKACAAVLDIRFGKCVHSRIFKNGYESDLYSSTSLMHVYVCCADLGSGEKLFEESPKWNVVGWTTLIAGYVNNDRASDAIRVFKEMECEGVEPNEITMVNVLVACAQCRDLETGRWVHERVWRIGFDPRSNVILGTAMLDMYAKCGSLNVARALFNEMPERNVVAWNSMIGAYNQYGRANDTLKLFVDMQFAGFSPDEATLLSLFGSCAHLGALRLGQGLHACVEKTNFAEDVAVGTSIMDMKDVTAWTSMITGFAMHGHGEEALHLFTEMLRDGSVTPDHITFIGVLTACSHAGLVDEGYKHFNSMRNVFGLVPLEDHYGCMVDLLSRAGNLMEAESLVKAMPIKPNMAVWGALLNGCEIHDNVDLAEKVENHIMELKPRDGGVYVLLANIYAKAGRWEGVKRVRDLIRRKKCGRTYGSSSIELRGYSYFCKLNSLSDQDFIMGPLEGGYMWRLVCYDSVVIRKHYALADIGMQLLFHNFGLGWKRKSVKM
ncbi:hypothetical protein IFM89_017539 [Coptis chinensis]|uniref:Cytochrome f large domain-containing protein n=1 Tax=Coptis chinensis TaxID=261450 RepID=A0A835HT92_9MAGN|nr:hypothetical protein IFM89_017539 [Coptis chinensis]